MRVEKMSSRPEETLPATWEEKYYPSLYSLCTNIPALQRGMQELPQTLVDMRPRDLEKQIRKLNGGYFDRTLGFIKLRFWDEYRRCMDEKKPMKLDNVLHGVCSDSWFRNHVLGNDVYLAWLVQPPVDVMLYQTEILHKAFAKISDALEQPVVEVVRKSIRKSDGTYKTVKEKKVNVTFLREIHAILRTMQDRIEGSVVQRAIVKTESKTVHAHVGAPNTLSLSDPNLTMEQLDAFHKKLTAMKNEIAQAAPEVLDAEESVTDDEGREAEDTEEGQTA